jgi:hypothetical protein
MHCNSFVPDFEWAVQGHSFQYSMNVLALNCYDMILGKDWLDNYSPMWVHWKRQILRFTHKKRRITLRGLTTAKPSCKLVSAAKLKGMLSRGVVTHVVQISNNTCDGIYALGVDVDTKTSPGDNAPIPELIASLAEYNHLFEEPTGLPPRRAQDHQIPLLPGAQPVKSRP